jgi:hypothetical protein
MAFRLIDKQGSVYCSRPVKLNLDIGVKDHTFEITIAPTGVAAMSALEIKFQGSYTDKDAHTGLVTQAGLVAASSGGNSGKYLAIGSTFNYLIADTNYSAAAATAGQAFSAAHVIGAGAGNVYGAINVYIDTSGVIQTLVPGVSQTAAQTYATALLAYTAADAWVAGTNYPTLWCPIGRLIIEANAAWTANTSNFTTGLTAVQVISFASTFKDITTYALSASELAAMGCMFSYKGSNPKWIRVFMSAITGAGLVSVRYFPEDSP